MRRSNPTDGEAGSILALSLGALAVAAVLIVTIAVASAVYLDRKELLALADAAAAHAATRIDPGSYLAGEIALTPGGVREAVEDYLESVPGETDLRALAIAAPTGTTDATTAQVTLTALSRPSFLPWVLMPWSDGIAMTVTASARGG